MTSLGHPKENERNLLRCTGRSLLETKGAVLVLSTLADLNRFIRLVVPAVMSARVRKRRQTPGQSQAVSRFPHLQSQLNRGRAAKLTQYSLTVWFLVSVFSVHSLRVEVRGFVQARQRGHSGREPVLTLGPQNK